MFGERVKKVRKSMKLTQVQFSKMLGVSKQTVSNWENDEAVPGIDLLKKIAEKCDVTTDYLLELDQRYILNVDDLPIEYVAHIQQIVNDLKKSITERGKINEENCDLRR